MLAIAAALAAFFVWGALVRPLLDGEPPVATSLVFGAGVALAGLIIWIVLGRIRRLQRAQRRALREREPQARIFGSYALNGVAAYLSRTIPLLGLGAAPRGLLTASPTGVIEPSGFRLVRGGARLLTVYSVPRDRIQGVTRGGIQEGAFLYPTLVIVVSQEAGQVAIPVPVTRDDAPLRRESPDGMDRLISDAARIWGVPVLGDGD
ncbi:MULTISPECIES: hypothetical protein [Microbacterium]|uniref:hypothetical protein n=1 Tax=Microbacterium TaxID=33882 RepID=UPI0004680C8B|nr:MULTISPECIES: hypothetical protein [Microbacterium]AMG82602.1 hypothetical protein AXH82_03750 [Microbacterium sp. PAMC 28756]QXE29454.1 hypothetical protein IZR02_13955 [Microbacterium paraoxydans]